jgi:hypothetical protein
MSNRTEQDVLKTVTEQIEGSFNHTCPTCERYGRTISFETDQEFADHFKQHPLDPYDFPESLYPEKFTCTCCEEEVQVTHDVQNIFFPTNNPLEPYCEDCAVAYDVLSVTESEPDPDLAMPRLTLTHWQCAICQEFIPKQNADEIQTHFQSHFREVGNA